MESWNQRHVFITNGGAVYFSDLKCCFKLPHGGLWQISFLESHTVECFNVSWVRDNIRRMEVRPFLKIKLCGYYANEKPDDVQI